MNIQTEIVGLSPPISTPDSSTRESPPTFARRFESDICFKCKKQGHWARDCPLKSPLKPTHTPPRPAPAINASDFPELHCPCGGGPCTIINSTTARNPGRWFYKCPRKPGGCEYFRWCDGVSSVRCGCGAGICSVFTEKSGPSVVRDYFVCPIPKGYGACSFFQCQDAKGNIINMSPPQSTLKNRVNGDFVEDEDFSCKRLKRMELESPVIDNPQHSPNFVVVSGPLKRNKLLLIESRERGEQSGICSPDHYIPLQDGSSENDGSVPNPTIENMDMPQAKSWDSMIEKAPKASLVTSQAEIQRRQTKFWNQILAAGAISRDPVYQILGHDVLGWLGRLAFPPSRCLTVPPQKPFYCCVFPSFDPIFIPQDPSVLKSEKSGRTSLLTPVQDAQLSSGVLWEPSGLKGPFNMVQGNITGSILEAFGQAAACIQNELLILLESMDPLDHESMVREATSAFAALDRLSVDYGPFRERVKEFIGCASALAGIEWCILNDISSEELVDRYDCAKRRFDEVSRNHAGAMSAFTVSDERLRLLREEASHIKSMLIQIEKQLSSCEAETVDLKTRLDKICEDMLESKQSLQAASQEAEVVWKLRQRREVERTEARAALEKARVQLRR